MTDNGRPRRRYFVQMRGTALVEAAGQPAEPVSSFFETYLEREDGAES